VAGLGMFEHQFRCEHPADMLTTVS
jgi:hypothetical protein